MSCHDYQMKLNVKIYFDFYSVSIYMYHFFCWSCWQLYFNCLYNFLEQVFYRLFTKLWKYFILLLINVAWQTYRDHIVVDVCQLLFLLFIFFTYFRLNDEVTTSLARSVCNVLSRLYFMFNTSMYHHGRTSIILLLMTCKKPYNSHS